MTTRFNARPIGTVTGYEGFDIPDDINLPHCGFEDIDRAIFRLFDKDLEFQQTIDSDTKKVPVIYATGERAIFLRRKQPLRDKSGMLILPLISIMRSSIEQKPSDGFGHGPGLGDIVIKNRISPDNLIYRRNLNFEGLANQEGALGSDKHAGFAVRGEEPSKEANPVILNRFEGPGLPKNIYEIISIPVPRFYTVQYEVTFWTQYVQQMNEMLEYLMSSYVHNPSLTFRLESDKGYWFVAKIDPALSANANFDGFADDERLVKYSFNISVNGYLINTEGTGVPSPIRRTVSAPYVAFDSSFVDPPTELLTNIPSSNPRDYLLEDLDANDEPGKGSQSIANSTLSTDEKKQVNVGGTLNSVLVPNVNPFTGNQEGSNEIITKHRNVRNGETVYRELGKLQT